MDKATIENRNKEVSLIGIFGTETIEILQKKIANATGFSVSTIDYRGERVVPGYYQKDYLRYRRNKTDDTTTRMSEALSSARAAITNLPYIFEGEDGLVKAALPIVVNEQYLGAMICGYVNCPDKDCTDPSTGERLIHDDNLLGNKAGMKEISDSVTTYTAEKISSMTELIYYMITQMCQKENYVLRLGLSEHNKVHLWDLRKKNRELKKKLKESKLISMKNNIQPQILLNMLVTLSSFAIIERAEKTQELIEVYTSFLRYYIEFGRDYIPLEQELYQIKKYLDVLKDKYSERITVQLNPSKEDSTQLIPKLILFPLIEYMINFGVLNRSYRGVVHIDTEYTEERCVVTMQFEHTSKYLKSVGYLNESGNVLDERAYLEQLNLLEQRVAYEYPENYKLSVDPDLIILNIPRVLNDMENQSDGISLE